MTLTRDCEYRRHHEKNFQTLIKFDQNRPAEVTKVTQVSSNDPKLLYSDLNDKRQNAFDLIDDL